MELFFILRVNIGIRESTNHQLLLVREKVKKNVLEKERVGQKRRTKRDKEEEKNLLRVPGDERTERSVHRRIWRGRREVQEVSGSAFGVLAKGRVRCLKKERTCASVENTYAWL